MDAQIHHSQLEAQFRCGGTESFVRWVEQTLGIRQTANKLWSGDPGFELDIVDTPQELEALIRSRDEQGRRPSAAIEVELPSQVEAREGGAEAVTVGSGAHHADPCRPGGEPRHPEHGEGVAVR